MGAEISNILWHQFLWISEDDPVEDIEVNGNLIIDLKKNIGIVSKVTVNSILFMSENSFVLFNGDLK